MPRAVVPRVVGSYKTIRYRFHEVMAQLRENFVKTVTNSNCNIIISQHFTKGGKITKTGIPWAVGTETFLTLIIITTFGKTGTNSGCVHMRTNHVPKDVSECDSALS